MFIRRRAPGVLPLCPVVLPHATSITAVVIGGLDTGFATRAPIDALPISGLGFSSPARLRRRDSSLILLGLPGGASVGVNPPGLLAIAAHGTTTRVGGALSECARRKHQQCHDYHQHSHYDLLT